uniref:Acylphosphatase 2 n=2 Tax=Rhinopithecus TaxID=542827 RepID=A0A2K6KP96_RHIBE
ESKKEMRRYEVSLFYLGYFRTPNVKLSSCLGLLCCWDYSYKFLQLSVFVFGQVIIVSEEPWKENIFCSSITFIKSTICLNPDSEFRPCFNAWLSLMRKNTVGL